MEKLTNQEVNKLVEDNFKDIEKTISYIYRRYQLGGLLSYEEFYQKSFLRVLKYMKTYNKEKCSPTTYLYSIIQSGGTHEVSYYKQGLDITQKIKKPTSIETPIAEREGESVTLGDTLGYEEEGFKEVELSETMEYVLSKLKHEKDRDIIRLSAKGYNMTEIAEMLDMKYSTCRAQKSKILKKLRLAFR